VATRRTEQAVVADLGESLGQDVLQKAAEEGDGVEGALPHEARPAITVAECHLAVFELFEAAVDERDAKDVAREVLEHLLPRPRVLNVHDPLVAPDGARHLVEEPRLPEPRAPLPAEQARERASRHEERGMARAHPRLIR